MTKNYLFLVSKFICKDLLLAIWAKLVNKPPKKDNKSNIYKHKILNF